MTLKASTSSRSLSGPEVREMFLAATAWLEGNMETLNAINVFPVPDGDTGTNMYLTMRSTMEEVEQSPSDGACDVLTAMSNGALMGARGNSGVILSQILRGLAEAGANSGSIDAYWLATGLEKAAAQAYTAVTEPKEGTVLTVVRDVATAAREALSEGNGDLIDVMSASVVAAKLSVSRTPLLLPVLAEAGVVDAGGQGLLVILEGMDYHLRGESMPIPSDTASPAIQQDWLAGTQSMHAEGKSAYGYCTEFLVTGADLDPEQMRSYMLEIGDSVISVGDDKLVRIHVHTNEPGTAITRGTSVGSLRQIKVDNMGDQATGFFEHHEGAKIQDRTLPAVVAVASGLGLPEVFRSIGATSIVSGGPSMNPSTREIVEAIEGCPGDRVIVLPNDKNVILTAEQATKLTEKQVQVVPSKSIPEGIAALLALTPGNGLPEQAQAMDEARAAIQTVEVCRAMRSTSIKGVRVEEGQAIAIVDDELAQAATTPEEVFRNTLSSLPLDDRSLISLYYGADTTEQQANELAEELIKRYPDHEVEVVFGGQPHYNYIASLE